LQSFYLSLVVDFKSKVVKDEAIYKKTRNNLYNKGHDPNEITNALLHQMNDLSN